MVVAGKKISRWEVLAEANTHLAHMRELLRRGLGLIPAEEHQILYDRYCRYVSYHALLIVNVCDTRLMISLIASSIAVG